MSMPTLRKRTLWNAIYKGIAIEVQNFGHGESFASTMGFLNGCWTGYIYLSDRNCPRLDEIWLEDRLEKWTDVSPERLTYHYTSNAHICDMPFSGGCTYYSKQVAVLGHRVVKIGCDYQHSWDKGNGYDENKVMRDLMRVVDHLESVGMIRIEVAK